MTNDVYINPRRLSRRDISGSLSARQRNSTPFLSPKSSSSPRARGEKVENNSVDKGRKSGGVISYKMEVAKKPTSLEDI